MFRVPASLMRLPSMRLCLSLSFFVTSPGESVADSCATRPAVSAASVAVAASMMATRQLAVIAAWVAVVISVRARGGWSPALACSSAWPHAHADRRRGGCR